MTRRWNVYKFDSTLFKSKAYKDNFLTTPMVVKIFIIVRREQRGKIKLAYSIACKAKSNARWHHGMQFRSYFFLERIVDRHHFLPEREKKTFIYVPF